MSHTYFFIYHRPYVTSATTVSCYACHTSLLLYSYIVVYTCATVNYTVFVILTKVYRTKNLPVVLYGCETWLLTLREKRRLRVVDSRLLWRILGVRGTR